MSKLQNSLSYPPRMMNADRAAAYLDLSKTKFLEGVQKGSWPAAKNADDTPRWDRRDLDAAVDALDARKRKSPIRRQTLDDLLGAEDGQGGSGIHQ